MVSPLELLQHRPGGTGKLKGQTVNTQTNLPGSNVFHMDFAAGKLVPITAAGLLPVGAVVTYEDRANPRRRYVVTGANFDQYGHGQACTCEDGHRSQVSRSAINGPGGWSDTGEVLDAAGVAAFLACAATEGARLKAEREQAEAVRQADHTQRRAEAIAKHPHLERVPAGGYSSAKLAAKNIRTELKAAFPGVKFSVTSDTFSGGDSVDIGWELGPTTKQVEAITGKYQEGSFNGMEDIYETDRENIWPDIFGGAKYVSENRSEAGALDLIAAALCDKWSLPKPADGKSWWSIRRPDDHSGHDIGNIARQILFAQAYPAGAVITGLEDYTNEDGDASSWARYYRATYTAPTQAAAASEAGAPTAGAPVVRFNEAKAGIEVSFATKPAPSVLEQLKAAGFRWSRFSSCWYKTASDTALDVAARVAGLAEDQRRAIADRMSDAHHAAGARGMEEACGIA